MRNAYERSYEDDGDEGEEDVTKALYRRRPAALRRAFLLVNVRSCTWAMFNWLLIDDASSLPISSRGRAYTMKQSQQFIENAENCAQLAERATDEPTYKRYRRMEAAWRALAEEQDWLDGEISPTPSGASPDDVEGAGI